jgi:hypothetical protein
MREPWRKRAAGLVIDREALAASEIVANAMRGLKYINHIETKSGVVKLKLVWRYYCWGR